MTSFLQVAQIAAGLLLVIAVLLQHRGTGLGGAFGGEGMSYRSRRGIEKLLLRASVIFATVFVLAVIAQLLIPSI
ncbi:MAG: preprotein translocase subunit SecG [Candidatus Berkelbacteria bacterium]|nr:MAG: preprotein translocase subunit SecG [Candidatus Berkelbacteria bacterium]QQG51890.1 MAG: preprotein translocase subunit SecG [Candidatus Berkelbacteria bacterium]